MKKRHSTKGEAERGGCQPPKWCAPGLSTKQYKSSSILPTSSSSNIHIHPQSYETHPYVEVKREHHRPPWDVDVSTMDEHRTLMESPPTPHQVCW